MKVHLMADALPKTDAPPGKTKQSFPYKYALPAAAILAMAALIERHINRLWICKCGIVRLWQSRIMSAENSQQFSDWYSPSHIIHGFILYGLTWLALRRWPVGPRLVCAMLVEVSWEILENSDFIINRYRAQTISLDYYGDSILNSQSDILMMAFGFFLASRLPVRLTVAIALALELLTLIVIRDNLTLNVIMLLHPLPSIRAWQGGL